MTKEEAVTYMATIADEHVVASPFADDGTDVDLDSLVGACARHFSWWTPGAARRRTPW